MFPISAADLSPALRLEIKVCARALFFVISSYSEEICTNGAESPMLEIVTVSLYQNGRISGLGTSLGLLQRCSHVFYSLVQSV